MKSDFWTAVVLVLVVAVATSGCAASRAFSKGERAARAGDWDAAVSYYAQASQADPGSAEYKIALERAQVSASRLHLGRARDLEDKGDLEGAIPEYRKAAEFDTANRQAAAKANQLEQVLRDRAEAARPKPQIEQMKEKARQTSSEPILNPASRQPLKFKFATGIAVRQILDFLAQASGINVMYESTFPDTLNTKSAIDLDDVTLEQALNLVLTSNNQFYKVLNPRTILIIPDTTTNRQKYEEQVIKTFYLNHADATEMNTLLMGLLTQQGVQGNRPGLQVNKSANAITMRASPALIGIAERIIDNNDRPRAEIVIDVEILEVNRTRVKQYGLNLSNYQIGMQFSPEAPPGTTGTSTGGAAGTTSTTTGGGAFNLNTISRGINTADFYLTVPAAVVKFLESDSRSKLIAKPSLRGAEGKKLSANLGDDIPVPTTTFSPLVAGGTGINPMTSFTYRQVGVNINVTARVTYDGDIILDPLEVESSTRSGDVNVAGQNLPAFGSRKVTTTMRLRNGESNLLAGLLRDNERKSLAGFPGGIHVPLIKQLFSANDDQIEQTDIVMLLTPRILRTQGLTERNLQEIYVGSSQNPSLSGSAPAISPVGGEPVAAAAPTASAPAGSAPPITSQPYGTPGAALVGGAPVGKPTAQGTPVVPPGSTPIPGTVMMPPAPPPAVVQPVVQPTPPPAPSQPMTQAPPAAAPAAPPAAVPLPAPATASRPSAQTATPPAAPTAAAGKPATGAAPPAVNPYGVSAPGAPPASAAQVTITAPGPDFRVGQGPYTVTLSAANVVSRITTISLTLTFNPSAVKIRSLQEGSFMRAGVPTTAFAHQQDSAAGRVDITISRTGDPVGATGSGSLAAIVFEAVAPGTVNFRVSGVASGPGGPVPLQFTPATVTVK